MCKEGRALREQIKSISGSLHDKCKKCDMLQYFHLFLDADIDDAQILTLTREDLNELFPGNGNFQLRRTIMMLITDTVKVMVELNFSGPPKILTHS